jgi:hypothetical protein
MEMSETLQAIGVNPASFHDACQWWGQMDAGRAEFIWDCMALIKSADEMHERFSKDDQSGAASSADRIIGRLKAMHDKWPDSQCHNRINSGLQWLASEHKHRIYDAAQIKAVALTAIRARSANEKEKAKARGETP